jgi:hypothetical protein
VSECRQAEFLNIASHFLNVYSIYMDPEIINLKPYYNINTGLECHVPDRMRAGYVRQEKFSSSKAVSWLAKAGSNHTQGVNVCLRLFCLCR